MILVPMFMVFVIIIGAIIYYLQGSLAPIDNRAATVTLDELRGAGLYSVLDPMFGNCNNNGLVDCTNAIQAAIDKAYAHERLNSPTRGVVFFPEGDYLLSDTLVALEDRETSRRNAIQLVGSTQGSRPRILLKENSFNDGNNSNDSVVDNKKAMIHLWTCLSGIDPATEKKYVIQHGKIREILYSIST